MRNQGRNTRTTGRARGTAKALRVAGLTAMIALALGLPAAGARDVVTVVGDGPSGDGGPAASAFLQSPTAVARGPDGSLYIVEQAGSRVRRVDGITYEINHFAGNGSFGYSGDGDAAATAAIGEVNDIVVDGAGNVYFSDGRNHVVRRVDAATGDISTIAGTGVGGYSGDGDAATNAQLDVPIGLALDAGGNLFIADSSNNLIRRIDAGTGEISTVAGDGAAGFGGDGGPAISATLDLPYGVAVDAAGDLYLSDSNNCRVRKVTFGDGHINTVAGNGACGHAGDGGLATGAGFAYATQLTVASDGDVLVTDTNAQRIRKFTPGGNISTVVGTGQNGFFGDGGAATDAMLSTPYDVAAGPGGEFFIADGVNQRVRLVSGGNISTFAGGTGQGGDGGAANLGHVMGPYQLSFDPAGNLYISERSGEVIRRIDGVTGELSTVAGSGLTGLQDGPALSARMWGPTGIAAFNVPGVVVALDRGNSALRLLTTEPDLEIANNPPVFGFQGDGGPMGANVRFRRANALAFSPDYQYLYIADTQNNRIRRWDIAADVVTTIAGTGAFGDTGNGGAAGVAQLAQPFSVAVDPAGNLYVSSIAAGTIRKIAAPVGSASIITAVAGTGTSG